MMKMGIPATTLIKKNGEYFYKGIRVEWEKLSPVTPSAIHLQLLFMALYCSEPSYSHWVRTNDLYSKARAMVLFDRIINQETDRLTQ